MNEKIRILQIISCFQSGDSAPLVVQKPGTPQNTFYTEQILGAALVEYPNGSTGIEWVVWKPNTRVIQITDKYFERGCLDDYGYSSELR